MIPFFWIRPRGSGPVEVPAPTSTHQLPFTAQERPHRFGSHPRSRAEPEIGRCRRTVQMSAVPRATGCAIYVRRSAAADDVDGRPAHPDTENVGGALEKIFGPTHELDEHLCEPRRDAPLLG